MDILTHDQLIYKLETLEAQQVASGHESPGWAGQAALMLKQWHEKWRSVVMNHTTMSIELLRKTEGSSVTIMCQNPEGSGPDNEAVEVTSDWTGWKPRRFTGPTLGDALRAACDAMPLQIIPPAGAES